MTFCVNCESLKILTWKIVPILNDNKLFVASPLVYLRSPFDIGQLFLLSQMWPFVTLTRHCKNICLRRFNEFFFAIRNSRKNQKCEIIALTPIYSSDCFLSTFINTHTHTHSLSDLLWSFNLSEKFLKRIFLGLVWKWCKNISFYFSF